MPSNGGSDGGGDGGSAGSEGGNGSGSDGGNSGGSDSGGFGGSDSSGGFGDGEGYGGLGYSGSDSSSGYGDGEGYGLGYSTAQTPTNSTQQTVSAALNTAAKGISTAANIAGLFSANPIGIASGIVGLARAGMEAGLFSGNTSLSNTGQSIGYGGGSDYHSYVSSNKPIVNNSVIKSANSSSYSLVSETPVKEEAIESSSLPDGSIIYMPLQSGGSAVGNSSPSLVVPAAILFLIGLMG